MMKNLVTPIGVLLILVGGLWALQGFDVIGGSAMSGKTLWAVVGPLVMLAGVGLAVTGIRRRG